MTTTIHLGVEPRARYHSRCLQEFQRTRRLHLRRYDAHEIVLHRQFVDGHNLLLIHHQSQFPLECLSLLSFPMELHTYRHIRHGERGILRHRRERQIAVKLPVPSDTSFFAHHRLLACYGLSLGGVFAVYVEAQRGGSLDTHRHLRAFHFLLQRQFVALLRISHKRTH